MTRPVAKAAWDARLTSPAFVGRQTELALLADAAGRARHGHGRLIFLRGEAGIGKTRLIRQAASVAGDMTVLHGRATAGASMPFRPLAEALNARLRTGPPPDAPEIEPFRPALARVFPEWRTDAGAGPDESRVVLAEGMLRLLAALGRERPVLLALEDLHDADPETLGVLDYLAGNLTGLPLLVLGSLRTGQCPALDLAHRARRDHQAALIDLPPLSEAEVARLAAACLDADDTGLPARLAQRLSRDSDGLPFVVEELLAGMVASGVLHRDGGGWRSDHDLSTPVPVSVVRGVADRADRLGPAGVRLLEAAAVMGGRFPLSVVLAVSELPSEAGADLVAAATTADLLRPDPVDPGWYAFRHALTADALLQRTTPQRRAALADAAARALTAEFPGLPGELCHLAAELRLAAGDRATAATLHAEAGTRALAKGAAESAAALLERAYTLSRQDGDGVAWFGMLEALLAALEETGEFDRARGHVDAALTDPQLTTERAVSLHSRLGWMAFLGGRTADAENQIAAARMLLGPAAPPDQLAPLDAVQAHVLSLRDGRADEAEQVALRAVAAAERVPLPEVACRARQLLALLARRRGFAAADEHLRHILRLAETHRLPLWRIRAAIRLASNHMIQTGESDQLRQARRAAWAMGAVITGYEADASLAMHDVFFGRYEDAARVASGCEAAMVRFRKLGDLRYALAVKAAAHAHRGARADMEEALAQYDRWGGTGSFHMPIVHGLCRAFCALLEEDRAGARAELALARDFDERRSTIYYQYGRHGLALLLDVLDGAAGDAEHRDVAAHPAAALRWNLQFVHFAHAALLGAAGDGEAALAAFARARATAAPFPTAHRLGLRLVAESALAHGWGDPVPWLREAEQHFQTLGVPLVAGACRALIRRAGQRAPQRRAGHDQVPEPLRGHGVTVREYEVMRLLAERRGNREIAQRLYLSHRTVEKHVASLMRKTGRDQRAALCDYAATFL